MIPRTLYFPGSPLSVAKADSPAETKSFKIQHSTHNILQPPSLQRFRSLLLLQRLVGVGHQRALNPNSAGQHTEFGRQSKLGDSENKVVQQGRMSTHCFFRICCSLFSLATNSGDTVLLCVILCWCCKATETA